MAAPMAVEAVVVEITPQLAVERAQEAKGLS
jgi:hypothetical protein